MKMKFNNKGLTVIEILLCFVLASVIIVSMMNILSVYKEKQEKESYKNTIRTYKNTLTKAINEDILENGGVVNAIGPTDVKKDENGFDIETKITLEYKEENRRSIITIHSKSRCYNTKRSENGKTEKEYNQACTTENASNLDYKNSEYYIEFVTNTSGQDVVEKFPLKKIYNLKFNDIRVTNKIGENVTNATNFVIIHVGLLQTDLGTKYDVLNITTPNVSVYTKVIQERPINQKEAEEDPKGILCKRAKTLHTENCNHNGSCTEVRNYDVGGLPQVYPSGSTITYGKLGSGTTLTTGDAFDCDVNGDGIFDAAKERFYYLTDTKKDTALLIYYNNTINGNPVAADSYNQGKIAYSDVWEYNGYNTEGKQGPNTAIKYLPTVEQWKNVRLENTKRSIISQNGYVVVPDFSYDGYAARMLSFYELYKACYSTSHPVSYSSDFHGTDALNNKCEFLLENSGFSDFNSIGGDGYWLENWSCPDTEADKTACYSGNTKTCSCSHDLTTGRDYVRANYLESSLRRIGWHQINMNFDIGIRPVIEVKKDRIEGLSIPTTNECKVDSNMIASNGPSVGVNLYYSDTVDFDKNHNIYTLVNPHPFTVGTDKKTLLHKYTTFSSKVSGTDQVFYVNELGSDGSIKKFFVATGGKCAN